MTITDDIVKGLRNPTPLYAVAGTADLAAEKLRAVPALIDKLRSTDPKAVQERVTAQAKGAQERVTAQAKGAQERVTAQAKGAQERVTAQAKGAQTKLNEKIGGFDRNLKERADLRKLSESVQDIALQGVGRAAGYALKARETFDELAERGKGAVAQWRGQAADEVVEIAAKVEPEPAEPEAKPATAKKTTPRRSANPNKAAE